jgi:hypothetical protein
MEIMSFRQRNNFALDALISTMLAIEKEKVNWATWFSQKLQNEIMPFSARQGKLGIH